MMSSGLHTTPQYRAGAWAVFGHSFGHNRLSGATIEEMSICHNLFVARWDGVGCGGWI